MQKIIIIGTLHSGLVEKEDLVEIFEKVKPDQILVELTQKEVENINNSTSIRDEMIFSYLWAQKNNIDAKYFDEDINVLKDGINGKEPDFISLSNEFKEILQKYSWKELNQKEPWDKPELKEIEEKINLKFIDEKRSEERDWKMLENIKNVLIDKGVIVVLTGTKHIHFFKENLSNSELYFK